MSAELLPLAILAGGLATRLGPLTHNIPKALLDIGGEPFIGHQLRLLRASGIERVVVCAGYRGDMIQDYLTRKRHFGLHVTIAFDGPRLLGTAGAVKRALPVLGNAFFVLYGDSYLPCDYRAAQNAFEKNGKLALMAVFRNQGCWDTSNVEFNDGRIVAYDKRNPTPGMHHIDYGLGVFGNSAFATVPDDQPFDLAVLYQELLKQGELAAYEVSQRFYEIGSLLGLEETRRYLAAQSSLRERDVL